MKKYIFRCLIITFSVLIAEIVHITQSGTVTEKITGLHQPAYCGNDWVLISDFSSTIGEQIVSGKGIEYTVIAEEENNSSGRTRIILLSSAGEKRMITNLPAFKIDEEQKISYYDIYEYTPNANYQIKSGS